MDNEAKLNLMKKRVIGSFKWQEDIIIPFSKEFGCTTEDLEDLFMDLLDLVLIYHYIYVYRIA